MFSRVNNFKGDVSIILILILVQFLTTIIEYKLTLKTIKKVIEKKTQQ